MAKCLGKRPAFLVQERPWSPSSTNFAAAAFCAMKDFGTGLEGNCNTELIRAEQVFGTLATGNASDHAAVWLLCSE